MGKEGEKNIDHLLWDTEILLDVENKWEKIFIPVLHSCVCE